MTVRPCLPEDDAALRRLAAIPMPGAVRVACPHEPSFFKAEALKGFGVYPNSVLTRDGDVCGTASRTFKCVWLDNEKQTIGYIGNLRLLPEYRGTSALARGYAFFRNVDAADGQSFYFTTIIKANTPVIKLLTADRAGMPHYEPAGDLTTFAMTAAALRRFQCHGFDTTDGETIGATALFDFYEQHGGQRHLFPVLDAGIFNSPEFAGLSLRDFIVVRRNGAIQAVVALWDQSALRQIRIDGYAPLLAACRPLLNPFLRLTRRPVLPRTGSLLNQKYLAFPLVRNDDPHAFAALLAAASDRFGNALATFALHAADPLQATLRRAAAWRYTSTLYFVHWDRARRFTTRTPRPFHIELSGI